MGKKSKLDLALNTDCKFSHRFLDPFSFFIMALFWKQFLPPTFPHLYYCSTVVHFISWYFLRNISAPKIWMSKYIYILLAWAISSFSKDQVKQPLIFPASHTKSPSRFPSTSFHLEVHLDRMKLTLVAQSWSYWAFCEWSMLGLGRSYISPKSWLICIISQNTSCSLSGYIYITAADCSIRLLRK